MLHQFCENFEWLDLQISRGTKYFFFSGPNQWDWGLIVVIVYYFEIWNIKQNSVSISRVISSHIGPMNIETPFICTFTERAEIIGQSHVYHVYRDNLYIRTYTYTSIDTRIYGYIWWNDRIAALEKTTWFHFRLMKTGFFFFFFCADHLLVGQLCRNPKSNRSLLSCLKVTQCSTSEICTVAQLMLSTDPSYDNRTIASTLKMQIRTVQRLMVMKTKFPATVMVFGVVSS